MSKFNSASDINPPDQLFNLRQQMEDLTRKYIDRILASHESIADQASLLSAILDSVGDALVVFDKDEQIILANRESISLAGRNIEELSRDEFINDYSFFKDDGQTPIPKEEEPYAVALRQKRASQIEGFARGPNLGPEGMWLRANASPVMDDKGNIFGVVTVFSDISERKRLEQQRDALATLITHDLKNHLAAEASFMDLLRDDIADKIGPEELQLFTELSANNQKYLDISNTLLEIYRSDLNKVESCRADVDLVEILNSVVKLNHLPSSVRGVNLKLSSSKSLPMVKGIGSALHQVFHNLIQNAVNVSPSGESVHISVSSSATHVQVEILDDGPGIAEDQIGNLFDSSRTATISRAGATSSGLGLYLCRLLIETQGGKISCKSKVGSSTRFTVELPV